MRPLRFAFVWVLGLGLAALSACGSEEEEACGGCDSDELCVQSYDGTCGLSSRCVSRIVDSVDCSSLRCDPACERAYCSSPYQCQNQAPCPGQSPTAFHCYGP